MTTTLNGSLLEQYYYPLQDGSINAFYKPKKNHIVIDILDTENPIQFLKINNGVVELNDIEGFSISHKNMNINDNDVIVLTRGTYQVFIEVAAAPSHLHHISSLRRDKAFYQDTAKKFAAVILPMLLLLLVDFSIEKKKPLKQLSIIYKKPTNANVNNKKMASESPNNTKKDTGHKSTKQPAKKIAHSKSGEKQQPKKSPQKKIAKTSAPSKKTSQLCIPNDAASENDLQVRRMSEGANDAARAVSTLAQSALPHRGGKKDPSTALVQGRMVKQSRWLRTFER